jgi:hypothetical protein
VTNRKSPSADHLTQSGRRERNSMLKFNFYYIPLPLSSSMLKIRFAFLFRSQTECLVFVIGNSKLHSLRSEQIKGEQPHIIIKKSSSLCRKW